MHTFIPHELWIRNTHGKRHFWNTKCVRLGNFLLLLMAQVFSSVILRIVTTPHGPVQEPLTPNGSMSL